jgi:LPXTG-site transpeptidase (sortase) family protein
MKFVYYQQCLNICLLLLISNLQLINTANNNKPEINYEHAQRNNTSTQAIELKGVFIKVPNSNFIPIHPTRDLKLLDQALADPIDFKQLLEAKGNAVVIGHKYAGLFNPGVFYSLNQTKIGDEIIVAIDGKLRTYKVSHVGIVSEDQVEIENETREHRLTLYTCEGWDNTHRFYLTSLLN